MQSQLLVQAHREPRAALSFPPEHPLMIYDQRNIDNRNVRKAIAVWMNSEPSPMALMMF
jgi:hypothetical protein